MSVQRQSSVLVEHFGLFLDLLGRVCMEPPPLCGSARCTDLQSKAGTSLTKSGLDLRPVDPVAMGYEMVSY